MKYKYDISYIFHGNYPYHTKSYIIVKNYNPHKPFWEKKIEVPQTLSGHEINSLCKNVRAMHKQSDLPIEEIVEFCLI